MKGWWTELSLLRSTQTLTSPDFLRTHTRFEFQFQKLTMGFSSSPAVYCRLMEQVMRGLLYNIIVCYVDDAVVVADDFDQMLTNLSTVLDRFRGAKLKLRPSKCFIFQHEVEFCGQVISREGRRICERRTACLKDLQFPTDISSLRSVIGFFSYNRDYIPYFADIIEPLTRMTRKGSVIEQSDEALRAFEILKNAVQSAPILALVQDEGDFVMDCDSSLYCVASILQQWQNEHLRVIEYASRCLNKHERNYCTTRREALAVVFGLKTFEKYLTKHKVVVRTDHAALTHYRTTPQPIPQVARHLDIMNSFAMELTFRQGASHTNADFISRLKPCNLGPEGEPCKQCTQRVVSHKSHDDHAIRAVGVPSNPSVTDTVKKASISAQVTRSGRLSHNARHPDFVYGNLKANVRCSKRPTSPKNRPESKSSKQRNRTPLESDRSPSPDQASARTSSAPSVKSRSSAQDLSPDHDLDGNRPGPMSTRTGDLPISEADEGMLNVTSTEGDSAHPEVAFDSVCAEQAKQTSAQRAMRKAHVISQLQRRAPIAVAAGAQYWDTGFFAEEQAADNDIGPVRIAMLSGSLKPSWKDIQHVSPTQRALWLQWDSLAVQYDVLYRKFVEPNSGNVHYQFVLPATLKMAVLELVHVDNASHLKFHKCELLLKQRVYWPTWKRDLNWFILCCEKCQAYHNGRPPRQALLRPLIHGEPRQRWAIDLCGPFRKDRKGFQYLFTAIDCFTRFAIVVPIRNKEAITVANCIYYEIFLRHGFADLMADRGLEFRNQYLDALMQLSGYDKFHTTSYHAASNGKVERFHRTFNSMLAKSVSESQKDWSDHVSELVFCYNACANSSTGLSPFYLMYGQNAKWNLDLLLDAPSPGPDYDSLPEYAIDLVDRLERAYHTVRKHLQVVAQTNKRYYDQKVTELDFKEGDEVRVFVPKKVQGRCPKLQSFYKDVGTIIRKLNDVTYLVRCKNWREDRVVHTDKLRLVHHFSGDPIVNQRTATMPDFVIPNVNDLLGNNIAIRCVTVVETDIFVCHDYIMMNTVDFVQDRHERVMDWLSGDVEYSDDHDTSRRPLASGSRTPRTMNLLDSDLLKFADERFGVPEQFHCPMPSCRFTGHSRPLVRAHLSRHHLLTDEEIFDTTIPPQWEPTPYEKSRDLLRPPRLNSSMAFDRLPFSMSTSTTRLPSVPAYATASAANRGGSHRRRDKSDHTKVVVELDYGGRDFPPRSSMQPRCPRPAPSNTLGRPFGGPRRPEEQPAAVSKRARHPQPEMEIGCRSEKSRLASEIDSSSSSPTKPLQE